MSGMLEAKALPGLSMKGWDWDLGIMAGLLLGLVEGLLELGLHSSLGT